ncbi:transposase InsO family protein [Prosthecobacter dejongeii]|uniref:Transposase InsO family protein n=1 Tax=Prosthecobacter dejongeii TaxID=48465 RepID=A0A7W7YIP0_9BACT|nr:transposase InsO family protein [Prosthecobacter dejongeii]
MVGPARKREAVVHLEDKFQVSQRRACKSLAQPRSTQRYVCRQSGKDTVLAGELRRFSTKHPRAGYRMAHKHLRREGGKANLKRVQRLWRQEGLRVPRKQHKKRRLGSTEAGGQRQRATRINEVWCYDFVFDQTEDGRRLKWLPICDEFTRENVALEVERRMEAADVVRVLEAAVAARGCAPKYIRSDNGPEFVAKAVREWIEAKGFETLYIKPGSPWQNAYSESFNSRMRDELLNVESFGSLLEAKVLGKAWRETYNHQRLHSSLGYQTPAEFAQLCRQASCAPLRQPEGIAEPRNEDKANTSNREPNQETKLPAHLGFS